MVPNSLVMFTNVGGADGTEIKKVTVVSIFMLKNN